MLYLDRSNINEQDINSVAATMAVHEVSTACGIVDIFESKMADYLGVVNTLATNSGTSALHLALLCAGVGVGDEVIVPALTFAATLNVVRYVGATPIIVDVRLDTWNIDIEEVENAITPRTKAIIPVHLYGNPCAMDDIILLARLYNLVVIEDAAESLGASYKNRMAGTIGDFGCFSFNGNKVMTTGSGGLLVAKDINKLGYARYIATPGKIVDNLNIGWNYKMNAMQAALGIAQLKRLPDFLKLKQTFRRVYIENLESAVGAIKFQGIEIDTESSCWFTSVRCVDWVERIKGILNSENIPFRQVFKPLGGRPDSVATYIHNNGLCLPSSTLNSINDVAEVCRCLKGKLF